MRKQFLVANWKMNIPATGIDPYLQALVTLDSAATGLIVAPPFPYLGRVHSFLRAKGRVSMAAQNCSEHEAGAFTGEVSATMIRDLGAAYVIVGHSERRSMFGEDDSVIGRKLLAVNRAGLVPILCVGEDEITRKGGGANSLLANQLDEALREYPRNAETIIAYEPVWAIGTGQNATPQIAAEAHRFIRGCLDILGVSGSWSILYGGSVTPENAAELAAEDQIDGFLVGGASLEIPKFRGIYDAMLKPASTRPR